jgi:hypothetical protein
MTRDAMRGASATFLLERRFTGRRKMQMAKRILIVALFAPMLALANPAPAAAHHVGFSFSIGLPFFGAVVGVPGPFYSPPAYGPPAYAPYGYAYAPVPAYAPYGYAYAPVPAYAPAPFYGRPGFYGARVFGPAHPRFRARLHGAGPFHGPRFGGQRFRRW